MSNTISKKVLERFMTASELEGLLNKYEQNKTSGLNRFDGFRISVTEEEMKMLRDYLDESKRNEKTTVSSYRMGSVALKVVFQKLSL